MKKALTILLAVLLVATVTLALTACSPCKQGLHKWDEDGIVTTPADCENEGVKSIYCLRCGDVKTEKIGKTDHDYGTLHAATDTKKAYYQCSVCHKYFNEQKVEVSESDLVILPSEHKHDYGTLIAEVPSTCLVAGTAAHYECSECHKLFVDEDGNKVEVDKEDLALELADHDYGTLIEAVVPNDCSKEGTLAHYKCSVCKKLFIDDNGEKKQVSEQELVVPAHHSYDESDWHEAVPSTSCLEKGTLGYYVCKVCSQNIGKDGNKLDSIEGEYGPHQFDEWNAPVAGNCQTKGTLGYKDCTQCHKHFDEQENVLETTEGEYGPHQFGEWHEAVAGDCQTKGTLGYKDCDLCHKHFNATGSEITSIEGTYGGHNYVGQSWTHVATIDSFGMHHMDCAKCGETGRKSESCTVVANLCSSCTHTYNEDEILTALFALASGESLKGTYQLTGVVTEIVTAFNSSYGNITVNFAVGGKTVQAYRLQDLTNASVHVADITVGATITVLGELTNFKGTTFEFKEKCELVGMTRAQYDVNVEFEPAGKAVAVEAQSGSALKATYEGGTELKFKINVTDSAYAVSEVKINGEKVRATDGVYTFTVLGHTTITVTLEEAGAVQPDPEVVASLKFSSPDNASDSNISGYNNTWTAKRGDSSWTLTNFNNNNKGWSYVRGCSTTNLQATIVTNDKMSYAITEVVVFIDSIQSSNGALSNIRLIVARDSSFTNIVADVTESATAAGKVTLEIPTPEADCYYKIEINCSSVSKNGVVNISGVDYYAVLCAHDWQIDTSVGEQGWTWNVSNGAGTADLALKCSKCNNTRTETVEAQYEAIYTDCTSNGTGKYTATVNGTWTGTKTVSIDPKGHTYNEQDWQHEDGDVHYHVCSVCTLHVDEESHVYSEYVGDNSDGNHIAQCDKCGYDLEEAHKYSETPSYVQGEDKHRFYCTAFGCEAYTEAPHSYDTDTKKCQCGAIEDHQHVLAWTHSDTEHWQYCTADDCEYVDDSSRAPHKFNEYSMNDDKQHNAKCETCSADVTQDHTLVYDDVGDSSEHMVSCQFCDWDDTEEHHFEGGKCKECDADEPAPKDRDVMINFVTNFATYAKSWGNSYSDHDLTHTDLGVTNLTFEMTINASKQSSTISDRPVSKTSNSLTLTVTDVSIKKVKLTLAQWGTKALGTMKLTITHSGGTTEVGSFSTFTYEVDLSAYTGVTKIEFSGGNSSNQVGWTSLELTVA